MHLLTMSSRLILRKPFSRLLPVALVLARFIQRRSMSRACCPRSLGHSLRMELTSWSGTSSCAARGTQSAPSSRAMSDSRRSARWISSGLASPVSSTKPYFFSKVTSSDTAREASNSGRAMLRLHRGT
uniref:Uncharacterized protein n=1 Tax=Ixodes ricinus TaxID=34613 RepID=A0A6B0UQE0_IXORI